jgi:hypothetical protein
MKNSTVTRTLIAAMAWTIMVRLTNRKLVPRAVRPGSEVACGALATDAASDSTTDSATGYGLITGGPVWENLMPDADPTTGLLPTAYKTELLAAGPWSFSRSYDSRSH